MTRRMEELIDQAIREAREALAIDPNSVLALARYLRVPHGNALVAQLATDREHALREATRAVARAIELDDTDPFGYALRGFLVMQGDQCGPLSGRAR